MLPTNTPWYVPSVWSSAPVNASALSSASTADTVEVEMTSSADAVPASESDALTGAHDAAPLGDAAAASISYSRWTGSIALAQSIGLIVSIVWWFVWLNDSQRELGTVSTIWILERPGARAEYDAALWDILPAARLQLGTLPASYFAASTLLHAWMSVSTPDAPVGTVHYLRWANALFTVPMMMVHLVVINGGRNARDLLVVTLLSALMQCAWALTEALCPALPADYEPGPAHARDEEEMRRRRPFALAAFVVGGVIYLGLWAWYVFPVTAYYGETVWRRTTAVMFLVTLASPVLQSWHLLRRTTAPVYEWWWGVVTVVGTHSLFWITAVGFMSL